MNGKHANDFDTFVVLDQTLSGFRGRREEEEGKRKKGRERREEKEGKRKKGRGRREEKGRESQVQQNARAHYHLSANIMQKKPVFH